MSFASLVLAGFHISFLLSALLLFSCWSRCPFCRTWSFQRLCFCRGTRLLASTFFGFSCRAFHSRLLSWSSTTHRRQLENFCEAGRRLCFRLLHDLLRVRILGYLLLQLVALHERFPALALLPFRVRRRMFPCTHFPLKEMRLRVKQVSFQVSMAHTHLHPEYYLQQQDSQQVLVHLLLRHPQIDGHPLESVLPIQVSSVQRISCPASSVPRVSWVFRLFRSATRLNCTTLHGHTFLLSIKGAAW